MAQRPQSDHIWDSSGQITSTGSADAYVITIAEQLGGYYQGMPPIRFKANFTNAGSATANIATQLAPSGIGAVTLKKGGGATDLAAGDIVSGGVYTLIYDAANFQVLELNGTVPDGSIGTDQLADGAVTTDKIANDAVTNAKLANMVQATIKGRASGAGTGAPQDLTAAQVRTILGISSSTLTTFSAAATADVALPAGFDDFIVKISNLTVDTDDSELFLTISDDNGATFEGGASDYVHTLMYNTAGTISGLASAGATSIRITKTAAGTAMGSAAGEDGHLTLVFRNAKGNSANKFIEISGYYFDTTGALVGVTGHGQFRGNANALTNVRLDPQGAATISGNYQVIGIAYA